MAKVDLNIELFEKQIEMYNNLNSDDLDNYLFYGSSRSGKTFLIFYWLVTQCIAYGANSLVVRETFKSLEKGMIKQTMNQVLLAIAKHNGYTSYHKMPRFEGRPFARYKVAESILEFYNGSYIQFAALRGSSGGGSESEFDSILSTEWGHIFADEISEIDREPIGILLTRLCQALPCKNSLVLAMNPTDETHWSFERFFKFKNFDDSDMNEYQRSKLLAVHFSHLDNKFIANDYDEKLSGLSFAQQLRFREGNFKKQGEGKIFKVLTWSDAPKPEDIDRCLIYTDPSATDSKNSDYKASVLLVVAKRKIFVLGVEAVQGTSNEMIKGIHRLWTKATQLGLPCPLYIEKKQVPIDFHKTFERFCLEYNWIPSFNWDTRPMGNKHTLIEGTLEPLVNHKDVEGNLDAQFLFCNDIKNDQKMYELISYQFLRYTENNDKTKKDDIPDACARGATLLNHKIVRDRKQDINVDTTSGIFSSGKNKINWGLHGFS